ncbi:MAG: TetR family transcriptional regulator [Pseudomonadota bacterium]
MTQEKPARRSQADRRAETRAKLIDAARELFVETGFADTATPDIVHKAGVTRGALYHHFKDKTDLFRALAEEEAKAIADHIDRATHDIADPELAMQTGSDAFFEAMLVPGRVRLLMEEAPAVLGHTSAVALTRANGSAELREGLTRALPDASQARIDALTNLLSAAFDRAALEIAYGGDPSAYKAAMHQLVGQVLGIEADLPVAEPALGPAQHRLD